MPFSEKPTPRAPDSSDRSELIYDDKRFFPARIKAPTNQVLIIPNVRIMRWANYVRLIHVRPDHVRSESCLFGEQLLDSSAVRVDRRPPASHFSGVE
jgi:hypothetical protein